MALITKDYVIKSPYPRLAFPECDMWAFIDEALKKYPDAVALENPAENRRLTFQETSIIVENIAANLLDRGFNAEYPLAICMSNCIEYVVCLLAVWRIGGKVAILNALLTYREIKPQLELLQSEFVVCNQTTVQNVLSAIPGTNVKTVISKRSHIGCVTLDNLFTHSSKTIPVPKTNPREATALIPFSSGTTGISKGVDISHAALVEHLCVFKSYISFDSCKNGAVVYQPFSHIYGITLVLAYLKCSQKIVIMEKFDLENYISLICKHKIDKLFLVPPIVVLLCKSGLVNKYDLSHVRLITSGAAPLSKELEYELAGIIGRKIQISQGYGLTETCSGVIAVPHPLNGLPSPQGTIGFPLNNCIAKVINEKGKNLGPNQRGEVCAKCTYLMKGYYKNPEATAKVIDSDGWFHTGDIGYYNENGCFFIVDRIKELIKYKGYQVPPAELEALLLTHPCIADVGVTYVPDIEAGQLPCAWVVKKPGMDATEKDIHSFVDERVAQFKRLRGGILFKKAIPKSASGKILRRLMRPETKYNSKL